MTRTLSRKSTWNRVLSVWVTMAFLLSTTSVGFATPPQSKVDKHEVVPVEALLETPAEEPVTVPETPAEEPVAQPEAPAEEPVTVPETPAEDPVAQPEAPAEDPVAQPEPAAEEPEPVQLVVGKTISAPAESTEIVMTPSVKRAKIVAPLALVDPVFTGGNPALLADGIRLDISELPAPGSGPKTFFHVIGDIMIEFTVTVVETEMGMEFSFSSPDYPVSKVVAKGGNYANIYNYDPPVVADSGLHSPVNPSGKWADISHLDFYFSLEVELTPAIEIVKSVDPSTVLAGETVTYTYVVTNTGEVDLHDVEVTDDKLGLIGTIDHLAVDESETLTADAVIEVDTVNVGTVVGYFGEGEEDFVEDSDDAQVNVIAPAIDVEKSVDQAFILAGETVTYTYIVTNIGDVDLYGVVLVDDKLGIVGELAFLATGDSETFTVSTALDVPTTNVVVATGADEMGHEVSDEDTAVVDVAVPAVVWEFDKAADETTASPGDIVTYTLTYGLAEDSSAYEGEIPIVDDYDESYMTPVDTNGGVVSGGKIYWTDANEGGMDPGETRTITYTMKVDAEMPEGTTQIDNIATLDVEDPLTDSWRVSVTVEPFAPYTPGEEEDFLPFTGTEYSLLVMIAMLAVAMGALLRMWGRVPTR